MAVGSNIGGVYKGRQGEGLATTFNDGFGLQKLQQNRIEEAAKAKKKEEEEAAKAKMAKDLSGNTWHFYQNDMAKEAEEVLTKGAQVMTAIGEDDIYTSTHPAANAWRLERDNYKRKESNINQYQKQYTDAISKIAVREDNYDKAYVDAVANFPKMYSTQDLASGQIQFPVPKIKAPGDLFSDLYVNGAKTVREFSQLEEGEPLSDKDIQSVLPVYFADPSKEDNRLAAEAMYDSLSMNDKAMYKDKARRMGYEEAWMAFAHDNMKGMHSGQTPDLTNEAIKFAKIVPQKEYTGRFEDTSGVTTTTSSTRAKDPQVAFDKSKSYFNKYDYLIDDEAAMAQLDISLEDIPDRSSRKEEAVRRYGQLILDNLPSKFTEGTSRKGQGLSDEEVLLNWDDWRTRLDSDNLVVANEAAKWAIGAKGAAGQQGPISDAEVFESVDADLCYSAPGLDNLPEDACQYKRYLKVSFSDIGERNKVYKDLLKTEYDPADITLTDQEQDALSAAYPDSSDPRYEDARRTLIDSKRKAYQNFQAKLRRESQGNTIAIPTFGGTYEQVLKDIHDRRARQGKSLFKTELDGPNAFKKKEVPVAPDQAERLNKGSDPLNLFNE